jgi:hypothetical protein
MIRDAGGKIPTKKEIRQREYDKLISILKEKKEIEKMIEDYNE